MNEKERTRLEQVEQLQQLDFDKYKEFKDITNLATQLCGTPISLITLLDEHTNWIKVATGVNVKNAPRETSFCQYGIQQNDLLIVPDATKDKRFIDSPLVNSNPNVRFYAGAPLILNNGARVGMLCLFDMKPHHLNAIQKSSLITLARQVVFIMELELAHKQLLTYVNEIKAKNDSLRAIAQLQSHEIRQPLTSIIGLINLVKDNMHPVDDNWLKMIKDVADILDNKIHSIVNESMGSKDQKLLRFNKMVEEIEDYAILLLDNEGNIENWNKGAEKIKGYKAEEIVGKNFSIFYTKEDIEKGTPKKLLLRALKNGKASNEGWRVRKDGSKFFAKVIITAIHNEKGEIIGFTKVTRDLS